MEREKRPKSPGMPDTGWGSRKEHDSGHLHGIRLERRFSASSGDSKFFIFSLPLNILKHMSLTNGVQLKSTCARSKSHPPDEEVPGVKPLYNLWSALQNRGYAARLRLDWAGGAGLASSGLCFAQPDGADG